MNQRYGMIYFLLIGIFMPLVAHTEDFVLENLSDNEGYYKTELPKKAQLISFTVELELPTRPNLPYL